MSVATTGKPSIRPSLGSGMPLGTALPTFTRSGTATRRNESGVIENVAANIPRFDYNPVTLALKGILVEEARTNLLLYSGMSNDGSPSVWTPNLGSITYSYASAPDSSTNAIRLTVSGTAGRITQTVNGLTNGEIYALSGFLQAGSISAVQLLIGQGTTADANLASGTVQLGDVSPSQGVAAYIEPYANSWYRVTLVFMQIGPTLLARVRNNSGSAAGDFYIWGMQLEACGAQYLNSSSYIPTAGVAVSRGADLFAVEDAEDWLDTEDEGTIFAQFMRDTGATGAGQIVRVSCTLLADNELELTSSTALRAFGDSAGGSTLWNLSTSYAAASTATRAAVSYAADDVAFSVDGAAAQTDTNTSGVIPGPAVRTIYLGYDGSSNQLNGWLQRVAFFDAAISDADLVTLTGGGSITTEPIVDFDFTETDIEVQTGDLDLPRIAYHDLSRDATITASSEADGYPADAAQRPDTYESWRPSAAALPATWQAALATAEFVNYMLIPVHDLATRGCSVKAQFSGDAGTWQDASDTHTPEDDSPILLLFSDQIALYWRAYITGGSPTEVPTIPHIRFGRILVMPYKISGGLTPPNLSRQTEIIPAISRGGHFLGQDIKRSGLVAQPMFRHLDPTWYRESFDPFVQDARRYPYGFAWRPGSYPDEVCYVISDADIRPTNMGIGGGLMQASVPMKGFDPAP